LRLENLRYGKRTFMKQMLFRYGGWFFFWVALLPAGLVQYVLAEQPISLDADRQFEYAQHCVSVEDYARAIAEYQRFVYFFPDDPRVDQARYRIGASYFQTGRFADAVKALEELVQMHATSPWVVQAWFMMSRSHERLHQPVRAVADLQELVVISEDASIRDQANYRTAWIYIESGNWETAQQFLDRISPDAADAYRLKRLSADLGRHDRIEQKNPRLAGALSVIPGGGFMYCGRYYDAVTAFLINTGLILAAWESFDDENYALGGVISFVEVGFYAGNIYGAVSSAHKYNESRRREFIENLKSHTTVSLAPVSGQGKGLALAVHYRF